MDELIQEVLRDLLEKLGAPVTHITVEQKEKNLYRANVETQESSLLIGYHGDTIQAIQQILKVLLYRHIGKYKKRTEEMPREEFHVIVDVDNYRKRQEENVINLAERKVDLVRKTGQTQFLPPMSAYFRRLVHLHLAQKDFSDIATESVGENVHRQITIKNTRRNRE